MAYSGIIELLGVKELAEYNTEVFTSEITDFKYKLLETAESYSPYETGNVFIYNFRDYCYLQSISLKNLISFIRYLQVETMRLSDFSIRGAITYGELEFEEIDENGLNSDSNHLVATESKINSNDEKNSTHIRNIQYHDTPAKLYGIIERLKGIGIFLDQEAIMQKMSGPFLTNIKNEFCLDNFYISEAYKLRYEHYIDCRIDPTEFRNTDFTLGGVMKKMPKSTKRQPKFGRYYIPILINLISSYQLDKIQEEDVNDFFEPVLTKIKTIVGYELVLGAILNKFFEGSYLNSFKLDNEQKKLIFEMQKKIAGIPQMHAALNDELKNFQIPKEILGYYRKKLIKQRLFDLA